jgi:hypothetical protein
MPPRRGIITSITTASGRTLLMPASASAPSPASETS